MDRKTILLVEDNPEDVTLTMRALRKANVLDEAPPKSGGPAGTA